MQLLSREGIEQLIEANPFAGFAAERGIALSPLGRELLVGRCPFEQEAVGRALLVEPRSGRYRCLACWVHGGNVIGFVMQLDRLTFLAALELLATRAGLDLAALMRSSPASPARPSAEATTRHASIRRGSPTPLWALTPPVGGVAMPLRISFEESERLRRLPDPLAAVIRSSLAAGEPSSLDALLALMPDEPLEYRLSELKLSPWGVL
jgi:hypothetical protein